MKTYYSLGTARYEALSEEAMLIGRALQWLLSQRNDQGTWGGPDALDEFISTTHVLMTLFAVGVSPDAPSVQPALRFLTETDKERNLAFYWRSGVLLNIEKYHDMVRDDSEFIWKNIGRVAVHKDYPLFFFLLKIMRFGDIDGNVYFSSEDVLDRILTEWTPTDGWYSRTSITTMALGLIYDMDFPDRTEIIAQAQNFVLSEFTDDPNGAYFNPNIVDDAFLIFNLAERDFLHTEGGKALLDPVQKVATRLMSEAIDGNHWSSSPPFGGSISKEIYPTAVIVRALLALHARRGVLDQISGFLIDFGLSSRTADGNISAISHHPFWGPGPTKIRSDLCFVLMPFSPPKLGEIFERYVRNPISDECGMQCLRADDIRRPTEIMRDVWEHINSARVIIADLTDKNANVFYELGMAHVLGKHVILIAQSKEDIPFDLSGVRCIIYKDSPAGYEDLAKKVVMFVNAILENT